MANEGSKVLTTVANISNIYSFLRQVKAVDNTKQVGNLTLATNVSFTQTSVDNDGGSGYKIDDEGSEFNDPSGINGGVFKINKVWQLQKGSSDTYLSTTAIPKNPRISEASHNPDRYYNPENDNYIAWNPRLKNAGIRLKDKVLIKYLVDGKIIGQTQAVVGDNAFKYAKGTIYENKPLEQIEMSPATFRALGIGDQMNIGLPKNKAGKVRINKTTGKPYQNPKYKSTKEMPKNSEIILQKIIGKIKRKYETETCVIYYFYSWLS